MQKLIMITGATDGIGKITANELAQKGHHIIIHGRNEKKAKRVVSEIKQETGNQNVDYLIADLFSMKAIVEMVAQFGQKYDHLDVLINNAGAVLDDKRFVTENGFDGTLALNVIAPLLLTQLLLPKLRRSQDGRIINMSSGTYRLAKPDMSDLNLEKVASGQARYGIAKLFVIWNTQHLAMLLQKNGIENVTVNVSHPGAVATNFGQNSDNGWFNDFIYKSSLKIAKLLKLDPKKGAVTNVYLADSQAVKDITGKFFNNKKQQIKPYAKQWNTEKERTVWDYYMLKLKPWLNEDSII